MFGYGTETSIIPWNKPNAATRVVLRVLDMGLVLERTRTPSILRVWHNTYYVDGPSAIDYVVRIIGSSNMWECCSYLAQQRDNLLFEMSATEQSALLEEAFLSFNMKPASEHLSTLINGYTKQIEYLSSISANLQRTMSNSSVYMNYVSTDFEALRKEEYELRTNIGTLRTSSASYESYKKQKNELEAWFSANINLESRLDRIRKYQKWKIYSNLKSGIDLPEDEVRSRITAYEEANTEIPKIRSQLEKLSILQKLSDIPEVDITLLNSEHTLRNSLQLQTKYETLQKLYTKYSCTSVEKMNEILTVQSHIQDVLRVAGTKERLEYLQNINVNTALLESIRNYEQSLPFLGIDISTQRLALQQQRYASIYSRIIPSHIDKADEMKSQYTTEQLHLCLSKLQCPHCDAPVSLQGGKLVKSLPLSLSPELLSQIELARSTDKSLRNIYSMYASKVQLMVRSEDELKRIEFLLTAQNPGVSSKDYYDAERVKSMSGNGKLDISSLAQVDLIALRNDIALVTSYSRECGGFTPIVVADVMSSLENIRKIREFSSLRSHYQGMLPNVEIKATESELRESLARYTTASTYPVGSLHAMLHKILELKKLGDIEQAEVSNDDESTLLRLTSEQDIKRKSYDSLVPVPEVNISNLPSMEARLNDVTRILSMKPAIDVLLPLLNQYNENQKNYNELMSRLSVCNSLYHKIDESKREWIADRLTGLNNALQEKMRILNVAMRKSHNIYISPFTYTPKGEVKGKPSINIAQENYEVKRVSSLCGNQRKMINLVLTLAVSELSPFPFILLDEPLTSSDEDMTRYVIENMKNITKKSIIMTTHRTSSVEFDHTVTCKRQTL